MRAGGACVVKSVPGAMTRCSQGDDLGQADLIGFSKESRCSAESQMIGRYWIG